METEVSGAAEAIQEVERLAKGAAGPQTIILDVPDGTGGHKPIPVLIHEGRPVVLTDSIKAAAAIARSLRASEKGAPEWREGTAEHQSLLSFIDHLDRFKSPSSVTWANPSMRRLVSVLDYHPEGEGGAAWGRHRGTYACPLSEAWTAWGGEKGLELSQEEFAELLDSRDYELAAGKFPKKPDAAAPPPAALVTLANNLEVYSTATAKRERDPNTGRIKISYSEDKGVSGTLMPPPAFLILIRVFEDSEPRLLEVRLRVTVVDGQAQFALAIHSAKEVLREAFTEVCTTVETRSGLPVFIGTPE